MESIDYHNLGLRVGLEIHQQLATKRKLFCHCKPDLIKRDPDRLIIRYMRPTLSETGEIDEASKKEFKKRKKIIYETYYDLCPYEVDEIPPYEVDRESLITALLVARLFKMDVPDILMVSRKQYLDGSVPSGFQRTILVALNGELELSSGKKIGINQICLEEDAARKIKEDERSVTYRVDRLGIPLIEITTDASLNSPDEVLDAALRIGALLRATGKARRGIGTIRQDINVSIKGGARIEIKGVQKPEWFKKLIDNEIQRQLKLIEIKEKLAERGITKEVIMREEPKDITHLFKNTKAKFIKKAISRGEKILGVKLPGFGGLLGIEIQPGKRFGKEFAERVSVIVGLKGIIHTDELPAYGISENDKDNLFKEFSADRERDCVAFVVGPEEKIYDAIVEIKERAIAALYGVPEETRRANPDGTTSFERLIGTAARLYPDTDSPPIFITDDLLREVSEIKVELPWVKIERYVKELGLSEMHAKSIVLSEWGPLFEELLAENVNPKLAAYTIVETFTSLRREGVDVDSIDQDKIKRMFLLVRDGKIAKEAIPDVLTYLAKNPEKDATDAIKALGLERMSIEELEEIIEEVIKENYNLIEERGMGAFSPLMGHVMKRVKGKIDGKTVSEVLRKKINEKLISKK